MERRASPARTLRSVQFSHIQPDGQVPLVTRLTTTTLLLSVVIASRTRSSVNNNNEQYHLPLLLTETTHLVWTRHRLTTDLLQTSISGKSKIFTRAKAIAVLRTRHFVNYILALICRSGKFPTNLYVSFSYKWD
jgi:hypothetical protein